MWKIASYEVAINNLVQNCFQDLPCFFLQLFLILRIHVAAQHIFSFRGLPLRFTYYYYLLYGITYYYSSENKAMELRFTQLVPVESKNVYLI